ncbi:hypothetical protein KTQ42_09055|uniref:hypothetical protein n=1 Tax=Noviherbaspirillum sp. L7-7A TaxID=2850560 RepID=UPI001C2C2C3C|nr:hypothetical protein [Noviherbaspirillum sp. L7-7A]MBV0879449.1 hypothetical protein [Noviherbaspirillum sp. L7-7A]
MKQFLLCLMACMPIAAIADGVAASHSGSGNTYLAGGEVRVTQAVTADLYAAGGSVSVAQSVAEDATLAGGKIDVTAPVGQDLRVTGGKIHVDARVGGDLAAAGGNVSISPASRIGGDVMLAGGDVRFAGQAMKDIKLAGGKLVLAGEVKGNARLYGQDIRLEPGARIVGDLVYASENPLSDEELALVAGKVRREDDAPGRHRNTGGGWMHPVFFISMLACGSILFLVFPNAVKGAEETMRHTPLKSLALGLVLLFALPPVAILFVVTLIGIPIGFGLMLLYPLLLLLGYLCAALFVGHAVAQALKQSGKTGMTWQIGFLALALLLFSVAARIPMLGGMLVFLVALMGTGALVQWLYRRYRGRASGAEVAL